MNNQIELTSAGIKIIIEIKEKVNVINVKWELSGVLHNNKDIILNNMQNKFHST